MNVIPIRELDQESFVAWVNADLMASKMVKEIPQTPMAVVLFYTLTMDNYRDSYQFNLNNEDETE